MKGYILKEKVSGRGGYCKDGSEYFEVIFQLIAHKKLDNLDN